MQVVVLAGGRGTRLRPFTFSLPKPLVPIGDRPILSILLSQLRAAKVSEVIVSTGYLAELLEAYCGDGSRWGLRLRYIHEKIPLNTAGALSLIDGLHENFLVVNGDVLTTLNYRRLWKHHLKTKASATMSICRRTVKIDFGVIQTTPSGLLQRYTEKPQLDYYVSMGVNVFHKSCLKLIKRGMSLSMPAFFQRIQQTGHKVVCFPHKGEWLDIGRPDDYALAQDIFDRSKARYLPKEY